MINQELLTAIVNVHNRLTEISVRGEDVIRMAEVLNICRTVAAKAQAEMQKENNKKDGIELGE